MNDESLTKDLYNQIIKENGSYYREVFLNKSETDAKDQYWKELKRMFADLSDENRETLFKLVKHIQVDTIAEMLGVLDGIVSVGNNGFLEFNVTLDGNDEPINGCLQDFFLSYVEENE
ncbi:hypothetical protein SAMN04487866_101517 [Thermoactinomyces sp. DSM 45891]|uniref:transposase n=1 Tax=Thermoactinomyces sp. DSM 45891 TaxID=1761907 RepID=UPI00091BD1C2|nr:transposase [Thermoactinomyces sp. DSM 45891]SFX09812.1 hypothetical protein SAMN04487866_101517 [Thermoactinomyces sp. DSM 45891]